MKAIAEESLSWGKEIYSGVFIDSDKREKSEAIALGVDQSTAHNYLDPESARHLPYGLAPLSLFAPELAEALCTKIGGAYIPIHGHVNGDSTNELKSVIKAAADLVKEPDQRKRQKLWKSIAVMAEKAILEEKE